jgi:hypothetical protein
MKGDQVGPQQLGTRFVHLRRRPAKALGNGAIAVVAQPLGIGHRDQEQIQRQGMGSAAPDMALTHQALIDPTELRRNPAPPGRDQQGFVHRDNLQHGASCR